MIVLQITPLFNYIEKNVDKYLDFYVGSVPLKRRPKTSKPLTV